MLHVIRAKYVLYSSHSGFASRANCKLAVGTEPSIKLHWLGKKLRVSLVKTHATSYLLRQLIQARIPVEDYRPGYPQFAALIASHASFHVCRRFLRLRARLLLLKQDELCLLESQLDRIDQEETRELFLSNRRRDRNAEREKMLTKLDVALCSYGMCPFCLPSGAIEYASVVAYSTETQSIMSPRVDAMLDRTRRVIAFHSPRKRDITNLRNWVENTSSLARDETAYLLQPDDLMAIPSPQDDALSRLSPLLEGLIRTCGRISSKVSSPTRQPKTST